MNSYNDDDDSRNQDDFGSQDPDLNDLKGVKEDDLDLNIDDPDALPKEDGEDEEDDGLEELREAEKELEGSEEDEDLWNGVDLGDELNDE